VDTLIYQSQSKACGYACVKMALAHYGRNPKYGNLPEPLIRGLAPSLKELVDFGELYGLRLAAYRLEKPEDLADNHTYPILGVINEGGTGHMVFIRAHRHRSFLVFDPARGRRKIKDTVFFGMFSGIFLQAKSWEVKPYEGKRPQIVSPLVTTMAILFQFVAIVSLFAGFYYISSSGDFLTPVLLFSTYGLVEIAQRVFLVRSMKEFDEKYLPSVEAYSLGVREAVYTHYTDYKTAIFSGAPSVFGGALEIAALAALLAMNDLYVGIGIVLLFALLSLEHLFLAGPLTAKKEALEALEQGFLGGAWKDGVPRPKGEMVVNATYRLTNFLSFRGFVLFVYELALALACTLLTGHVSLNYFILALMSFVFLGEEFVKLLSAIAARERVEREEAYFIGHFLPRP
jgi:predicted double-glycine peptidase